MEQILEEADEFEFDNISNPSYKSQIRKLQQAIRSWEEINKNEKTYKIIHEKYIEKEEKNKVIIVQRNHVN